MTRIDEKVTDEDLDRFLKVVQALPDHELPTLPPVFSAPPEWDNSRTLTVVGLVHEELAQIEERWKVDWLARRVQRNRALQRAVREQHLTIEQFFGLYLTLGVALSRTTLHGDQDLDKILDDGRVALDRLRENQNAFHSLRPDVMHYVLRQAVWITRTDRAKRLKMVPPENLALVHDHLDELNKIFPDEFKHNPLDAVADLLDEQGLPFEELADRRDSDITWSRQNADIGHDTPDQEPQAQYSQSSGAPPSVSEDDSASGS